MKFETSSRSRWERVTRSVQAFPTDMVAVVGLLVLINVAFRVPSFTEATVAGARVQTLVAIPTLLLVPGYVLVAIVFPASATGVGRGPDAASTPRRSIDWVERAALSFGMSVAVMPIFAVALGAGWEFTSLAVLDSLSVLVVLGVALAAITRFRTPPEDRYSVGVRRGLSDLRRGITDAESTLDGIATLVLAIAVLAAFGAVGYAVATPYQSGPSSTFYLVTENETGAQVASGYPTEFTAGVGQELIVGVRNDEERPQAYTVVIRTERMDTSAGEATVTESSEVDRLHTEVAAGETWTASHSVAPEMVGEDLRLHYYLYKGESAPEDPDAPSAYRDVYIWIDVTDG